MSMPMELIADEQAVSALFTEIKDTFEAWEHRDHLGYVGDGFGNVVSVMDHSDNELLFFYCRGKWSVDSLGDTITDREVEARISGIFNNKLRDAHVALDIVIYRTFIEQIEVYLQRMASDAHAKKKAYRFVKLLLLESTRQGKIHLSRLNTVDTVDVKLSKKVLRHTEIDS